jgi:hypothetical protein
MCLMCEEEALYRAYLEYMARKETEAAADKAVPNSAEPADKFHADDVTVQAVPAAKT